MNNCQDQQSQQFGLDRARIKRKQWENMMLDFFAPFQEYFLSCGFQYLIPPKPTYVDKEPHQQKISLSQTKQLEYFRASTPHYISEELLSAVLRQEERDRGLVENVKNRSHLDEGKKLYFGSGFELKQFTFRLEGAQIFCDQVKTVHKFCEPIMELFFCSWYPKQLVIRCRYFLYWFSMATGEIIKKIRINQETTAISRSPYCGQIFISAFDSRFFYIYSWNLEKDSLLQIAKQESYYPVVSQSHLNNRQILMSFNNKMTIFDCRRGKFEQLLRINKEGGDRLIAHMSLRMFDFRLSQIVIAKSQNIDILDLRNVQSSVASYRHMCEQSPPSCLSFAQYKKQLLIAHSPHCYGSSLMINIGNQPLPSQHLKGAAFEKTTSNVNLLFDSGKIYKGLHPSSISSLCYEDKLLFFHLDSSDGICLEAFIVNTETDNLEKVKFKSFPKMGPNPLKQWIVEKNIEPFVVSQKEKQIESNSDDGSSDCSQEDSLQSDDSELILEEKPEKMSDKNNYCSLDKFYDQIKRRAKREEPNSHFSTFNNCSSNFSSQNTEGEKQGKIYNLLRLNKDAAEEETIDEALIKKLEQVWRT